jgi:hypothetical protein
MTSYLMDLRCPKCGQVHRVSNDLRLDHGPTEPGTLSDLYGSAELPRTLANLLHDLVWCDQSAAYIQDHDPARIYLFPNPPPPPLER